MFICTEETVCGKSLKKIVVGCFGCFCCWLCGEVHYLLLFVMLTKKLDKNVLIIQSKIFSWRLEIP